MRKIQSIARPMPPPRRAQRLDIIAYLAALQRLCAAAGRDANEFASYCPAPKGIGSRQNKRVQLGFLTSADRRSIAYNALCFAYPTTQVPTEPLRGINFRPIDVLLFRQPIVVIVKARFAKQTQLLGPGLPGISPRLAATATVDYLPARYSSGA